MIKGVEFPAPLATPASTKRSHGITSLSQSKSGEAGRGRERERERAPKMDMANLFKHFFRELILFLDLLCFLKAELEMEKNFCFEFTFKLLYWRCRQSLLPGYILVIFIFYLQQKRLSILSLSVDAYFELSILL